MFKLIGRAGGRQRGDVPSPSPPLQVQGYVDERATTHIAGWLRNPHNSAERLDYEVVLALPEGSRIIANGRADRVDQTLKSLSVGDGEYGFRVDFSPPLSARERDHLIVRAAGTDTQLELAPQLQGYVDERSTCHVAGWIRNRSEPTERVAFEVVLVTPSGERILGGGQADQFNPVLHQLSVGDATYSFRAMFPEPLTEEERDQVIVRAVGERTPVELAPQLRTEFEPISHIAMDIVNNCNLRCPFCVFDYADTRHTRMMSETTYEAVLGLIPHVTDGNFWLSCLHEATLHPELLRFIERVPRQWRHKVMYTTNLAKPMPDVYFQTLADSGLHHINISLESLDPEIYERMRAGARWRIFSRNWDKLLTEFRVGNAAPRLRYNIMAYRSNLPEIPGLVKLLRSEKLAWQVEVRHTFDVGHIPDSFRSSEFLVDSDWDWLAQQLAIYSEDEVLLLRPPAQQQEQAPAGQQKQVRQRAEQPVHRPLPHPLNIRMEWDGKLIVYGEWTAANGKREHEQYVITNIHHLRDPLRFLLTL